MRLYVAVSALVISLALSACGGSDEEEPHVTVAKEVDSIQCDATPPESLDQLDAALVRANIFPIEKYCASDGYDRPYACGIRVFYLRVIKIPDSQLGAASALGYKSTQQYPRMVPLQCAR